MAGIVTNPTGTLGGVSYANLQDAACHADHQYYGEQDLIMFTDVGVDPEGQYGDLAVRLQASPPIRVKFERWLTATMICMRTDQDMAKKCPPPPLVYPVDHLQAGQPVQYHQQVSETFTVTDLDGQSITATYELNSVAADHTKSCRENRADPTGGYVTFTRYDDLWASAPADGRKVEGVYDLTRGSERVTGSFSAPRIEGALGAGSYVCLDP